MPLHFRGPGGRKSQDRIWWLRTGGNTARVSFFFSRLVTNPFVSFFNQGSSSKTCVLKRVFFTNTQSRLANYPTEFSSDVTTNMLTCSPRSVPRPTNWLWWRPRLGVGTVGRSPHGRGSRSTKPWSSSSSLIETTSLPQGSQELSPSYPMVMV